MVNSAISSRIEILPLGGQQMRPSITKADPSLAQACLILIPESIAWSCMVTVGVQIVKMIIRMIIMMVRIVIRMVRIVVSMAIMLTQYYAKKNVKYHDIMNIPDTLYN